jgi:hypothetical protein
VTSAGNWSFFYSSISGYPSKRAEAVFPTQEIASPISVQRSKDHSRQKLYYPVSSDTHGCNSLLRRNIALIQRYAVLPIVSFVTDLSSAAVVQCSVTAGVLPGAAPATGDTTKGTLCVMFEEQKLWCIYDIIWYRIWYDTIWYMIWYDIYDTIWYMTRYDIW